MFEHILVPLDGSALAECTLPHVIALAKTFGSRITLLRVMECPKDIHHARPVDPLEWQLLKTEASAYLDEVASRLTLPVERVVLEGQPAIHVVDYIRQQDVDLVVISSHGESGLSRWNLGSVGQKIVLRGHVSTLVVRAYRPFEDAQSELRYRRLLVPLDGSRRAECVLPAAAALARKHGTQVLLAHVVQQPAIPRLVPPTADDVALADRLTERNRQEAVHYLEQVQQQLMLDDVETRLLISPEVAVCLHGLAEEEHVDLIIMSAHGYSGQKKWPFGAVTTSFIHYGSVPLLFLQDLPLNNHERSEAEVATSEYKGH